ncbi:MAG: sigma-70 family RNA polymerase sigma factor [Oscillospiraceae bacterium]|nr:sigma-70 family RNA polymerase sigma factor [Oscillospiraceae bacterium]
MDSKMALAQWDDEALVLLVQGGGGQSPKAFGLLLERITPVVKARVRSLAGEDDAQDLTQEGMLGFLSAVSAYRPERGASFRTFASVCVSNRIVSALRRAAGGGQALLPLPEESALAEIPENDPQDIFAAMESTRRIMEAMQERLSALERGVIEAYLAGEPYELIAGRLNISAKAVDNALQRVRKKLRQFL